MKKLLITGGAGFIGSEFVRQVVKAGRYHCVVVDDLTYAGDRKRLNEVADDISFYKKNITDATSLKTIITKEKPAKIVHFAAETHVDRSIADGQVFLRTNVMGTHTLLELARAMKLERFIYISTDEVYGEIAKGHFNEGAAFHPNSPYAVSKASADMLVSAHARTYGLPINIIRPSNAYGPWQWPEKLIPVVIYKALNNKKIPVYAKGLNVREWMFVEDCAQGIMKIVDLAKAGDIYNLGSGMEQRNIDVVRMILRILGKRDDLIQYVKDRPGHDLRYSLDCAKIRRLMKWQPRFDFNVGLAKTVAWYEANQPWLNKNARA